MKGKKKIPMKINEKSEFRCSVPPDIKNASIRTFVGDFIRSILDKMCYISLESHPKWNVDGLFGPLLIAPMYIHFLKFISDSFSFWCRTKKMK